MAPVVSAEDHFKVVVRLEGEPVSRPGRRRRSQTVNASSRSGINPGGRGRRELEVHFQQLAVRGVLDAHGQVVAL